MIDLFKDIHGLRRLHPEEVEILKGYDVAMIEAIQEMLAEARRKPFERNTMKRFKFFAVAACLCGMTCLHGCTTSIESPAKAFKFSNPAIEGHKNIFGAGVKIPTDVVGKGKAHYDAETGSFDIDGEFNSSASNVVNAESARGVANLPAYAMKVEADKQLKLASIQAQQACIEKGMDTIQSVGGAFLAIPKGSPSSGPGLLSTVLPLLTGAGIGPAEILEAVKALKGNPTSPASP